MLCVCGADDAPQIDERATRANEPPTLSQSERNSPMTSTQTISVSAARYVDYDDSLTAAAAEYVEDHGLDLDPSDLRPRWEDDSMRDSILLDVPSDLAARIEAAIEGWDGAEWTHPYTRGGTRLCQWSDARTVCDDAGEPVLCDGEHEDCSCCEHAAWSAQCAQDHGREALRMLEQGDIRTAIRRLKDAAAAERAWGDTPTWGPVLRYAESLIV